MMPAARSVIVMNATGRPVLLHVVPATGCRYRGLLLRTPASADHQVAARLVLFLCDGQIAVRTGWADVIRLLLHLFDGMAQRRRVIAGNDIFELFAVEALQGFVLSEHGVPFAESSEEHTSELLSQSKNVC